MKPGTRVIVQYIEPIEETGSGIMREIHAEFVRLDSGGLAVCQFPHSNLEFETVPWAVKRFKTKRKKKKVRPDNALLRALHVIGKWR